MVQEVDGDGGTVSGPEEPPRTAATAEALLLRSIEVWKRKLLDLTKRNRALHFRPTRVSTVAIVDEQPAEVFRHLYLREKPMRFRAAPGPTALQEAAEPEEAPAGEPPPALDFVPYDSSALDGRHTDEWLQTTSTREALDKSLRRLDEQSRLSLEEQGVNTLFLTLGMLHYAETDDGVAETSRPGAPPQLLRAPLLLLPVELTRKSARSGYSLRITDDDPLVNPALAEYLRLSFGITLPELPDSSAIPEEYDLQEFMTAVQEAVAQQRGWAIKTEIYLAMLSFQKLVMYKDLETNAAAVQQHRVLRRLVTRDSEGVFDLPAEARAPALELDRDYPPETTFQVVDADASQLRLIAAAARGYDLVIEGPPGTGKSQTITNLIAQALAAGKSVLFVAEKMAALSVVHRRLAQIGLGEFCLELHSTKGNKRDVMRGIAAALDASLQRVAPASSSFERLPRVRATLSEHVEAVHSSHGALGLSPYQANGELGQLLGAPRWTWSGPLPVAEVTREALDEAVRQLTDLAVLAAEIGPPTRHPWRDTARTFYSPHDLERVEEAGGELLRQLADAQRRAAEAAGALQLPPIETFSEIESTAGLASVLARSPGAPLDVLSSAAWNTPPPEASALITKGRDLQRLTTEIGARLTPTALERDHAGDVDYIEQKLAGLLSFLAVFDSRYRAIKQRWLSYRLPAYPGTLAELGEILRRVDRLRRERQEIEQAAPRAKALFGALWRGEHSDWDQLEEYVRWVVELRGLCVRHGLGERALERATLPSPDLSEITALSAAATLAGRSLSRFRDEVEWPAELLQGASLAGISERVGGIVENLRLGPPWAAFEAARQTAGRGLARDILAQGMNGDIPFAGLAPAFRRAFYLAWLSDAVRLRPPLAGFHTLPHEERIAEFRLLDERVLADNRAALVGRLREQTQNRLRQTEAAAALAFLRREMARQRGLSPLRRTLREGGAAVRAIKPCLLMSPLSVAQYLGGTASSFDLVLFDEASQLPTEDSVGAVLRGRQLVVVGDPKQLPPTNFFASTLSDGITLDEDGNPSYEDSESILEELRGAGFHGSSLRWHYRSAHESLIHFSNVAFYDAGLQTFPSVETSSGQLGLGFELIPNGVYEGKGLNPAEARRVTDEVICFAREQLARTARGERPLSLGVGTFSLRQQVAIQDELEQRRRDEPALEPFFERNVFEPFFVKNLENIQGDERDVIFLSVTYGRGADGRIRYNFGPLNGQNGWRRLNVLTTRARHHMRVFSSMRGDEMSATAVSSPGPRLLRDFLLYAEKGRLDEAGRNAAPEPVSRFEMDVFQELSRGGLRLVPRIGASKDRIAFGVLDDRLPGRFLCGIECDGEAYRDAETARDRDRLRHQILESRGWTLFRVWSTDWFKDRAGQIDRLLRLIREALDRALEEAEARERAAEEAAVRARQDEAARLREAAEVPATPQGTVQGKAYERPLALPYTVTPGEGRFKGRDLLATPLSQLAGAVDEVLAHEAPIHAGDLFARVAGMWGSRNGKQIQRRIQEACDVVERGGALHRRGEFLWRPEGRLRVRSRSGVRIPADRIAPEEYAGAVLAVLATGFGFSRSQLIQEARSVLGFSRTGSLLDEAIGAAIDRLLGTGQVGEGSQGIRLRTETSAPPTL